MGREAYERMTTLPPMSSFHQDTIQGQRYHHASPVASPLTSNDPSVLGKTLKVARTDVNICRSHISTKFIYQAFCIMVVFCFLAQVSRSGSGSQAIGKALASVCMFYIIV